MPACRCARAGLALCVWLVAGGTVAAGAAAATPPVAERWFELQIAQAPAGYVHESLNDADPAAVRTTTESLIVLQRLEARVELTQYAVATEGRDGHLTAVHSEIRTSKDTTVLDVAAAAGELAITTTAGGLSYRRVAHEARTLLGPEGIRALTAQRLAAGADTIDYATFLPELGSVAQVTRRVIAREAAATGRPPSYAVEETMDVMPTPSRLVVDADGRVVEETMPGPFGDVRVVAATAAVRDRVAGGGPLPEELFSRALVRANVRLPEPRAIERLRVRIDLRRPQAGFPELEGPYQHVLERGADHVVLEVSRAPAGGPDGPADAGAAYTEPNFILQSDHPDVVALARSLRHPGAGPYAQARALQDWAAEHMRFDAGLAMLPASEVVRDRGGTCVAYSVLLASLARALGIPARIVMGYVYVANVWGGHAWTEIRAGGRWIPLDAAVYRAGPADAARIALVRHSGEQGAASGAAELGRLFGNESIRILGYRVGARWVEVPAGAAPYRIDGDRYRNPWLGLSVQRPPGFAFAKADSSYPDLTVIALDGPDGSEIRLRQSGARSAGFGPGAWLAAEGYGTGANGARVAGHAALRGTAASRAALAFRDGADLWLLEAEGAAARRRLDEVAGHLVLRRVRAAAALAHGAGGR